MKTHTASLLVGAVIFVWGLREVFVIANADWSFLLAGAVVMAYGVYSWIDAADAPEDAADASDADAPE